MGVLPYQVMVLPSGAASTDKERAPESASAAPSGTNEDDSAMLFYHDPSLPKVELTEGQAAQSEDNNKLQGGYDAHPVQTPLPVHRVCMAMHFFKTLQVCCLQPA